MYHIGRDRQTEMGAAKACGPGVRRILKASEHTAGSEACREGGLLHYLAGSGRIDEIGRSGGHRHIGCGDWFHVRRGTAPQVF